MKVNLNIPYCSITGEQVKDPATGYGLALKTVIVNTLQNPIQGQDGEAMLKRFELAKKVYAETGEFDLKEVDRDLILKAVRESGNTLAYGILNDMFGKA